MKDFTNPQTHFYSKNMHPGKIFSIFAPKLTNLTNLCLFSHLT